MAFWEHHKPSAIYFHYIQEKADSSNVHISQTLQLSLQMNPDT